MLKANAARSRARRSKRSRQSGFTLIEMMFTVAIIGVLALVAQPSYGYYVVSSKRTEAVLALRAIWDAQTAYKLEHENRMAGDFDTLGLFQVEGGQRIDAHTIRGRRYTYRISQPWGEDTWYCTATADLDGDPWPDVLVTGEWPIVEP